RGNGRQTGRAGFAQCRRYAALPAHNCAMAATIAAAAASSRDLDVTWQWWGSDLVGWVLRPAVCLAEARRYERGSNSCVGALGRSPRRGVGHAGWRPATTG